MLNINLAVKISMIGLIRRIAQGRLSLHAHLVEKAFCCEHLKRLEETFRSVCADFEVPLKTFNGEADHVHLLVNYPPKVGVCELQSSFKGSPLQRCSGDRIGSALNMTPPLIFPTPAHALRRKRCRGRSPHLVNAHAIRW
jgi:REP element-mobilizing transposase RayT